MPDTRFWRVRKFIRDTGTPIPYSKAKKWDMRLGIAYNLSSITAFCLCAWWYVKQESAKNVQAMAEGRPVESNAQYWARTLGIHGATIKEYGLTGRKTAEYVYEDPERLAEERDSKPRTTARVLH